MRVALVQNDLTVGDYAGNLRKLLDALAVARDEGVDLAVTSELALSGYPPKDLVERPAFLRAARDALDELVRRAPVPVLVGVFLEDKDQRIGHGLWNAAVLIENGRIVATQKKSLLPTYDVFDEHRHFDPAPPESLQIMTLGRHRLAVTICEDIWNVPNDRGGLLYPLDPPALLAARGADLLINLSASPFTLPKRSFRPQLLAGAVARTGLPLVFVNQVGGMDELLFDGHSMALAADGRLIARAREFAEDLVIADFAAGTGDVRPLAEPLAAVLDGLVLGTRDYAAKCGFKSAVLGLSGGIDSALTAAIAVRALGRENVVGVAMPSRYSSGHSVEDARLLAENLGMAFHQLPIEAAFTSFLSILEPMFRGTPPSTAEENLQARSRGVILMALSNKFGHLLLTTGNKSELAVGYCTLYGDMAGGLAVISDVPKTMVYKLSEEVNRQAGRELIPSRTLTKPPSAELRPDQTDQDSLPPYEILDAILELHVEGHLDAEEIAARGFELATVREVVRLVRVNEYKRQQAAPGLILTSKAFGSGRRVPITQRATTVLT